MNIGEFFVSIGLKGQENVGEGLTRVKGKMGEVRGVSLEAKAAILGAFYGLQQMTSASIQAGTAVANFNGLTNIGTTSIQRWANAFRQVRVDQNDVLGTMQKLQSSVTKWKDFGDAGISQAFAYMGNTGIELDSSRYGDIDGYLLPKMIEYLKAEKDVGRGNEVGRMLGFSDDMIRGSREGKFTEKEFSMGGVMSEGQMKGLRGMGTQWDNLNDRISKKMQGFVVQHGPQLIKDMDKVVTSLFKLADAVNTLAKNTDAFGELTRMIDGLTIISDYLSGKDYNPGKYGKKEQEEWDNDENLPWYKQKHWMERMLLGEHKGLNSIKNARPGGDFGADFGGDATGAFKKMISPKTAPAPAGSGKTSMIQKNEFNVGPGQDPQAYADAIQPHLDTASRQMFSQAQLA